MSTSLEQIAEVLPIRSAAGKVRWEKCVNMFAGITQFLAWPFLAPVFRIFYSIDIEGRENFSQAKSPFVIVCNHIAFYDSFLFRLALGLWTPHLPLRFMAVDRFDWPVLNALSDIGAIDLVYSLFGVFTITPGRGAEHRGENLEEAKLILEAGGNVVIYPEGRLATDPGIGTFKKGAAVLVRQTGASVVPVSFKLGPKGPLRRKISIRIGGPLHLIQGISEDEATASFFAAISDLYNRA